MKVLSLGKRALFAVALVQAGLFAVTWFLSIVNFANIREAPPAYIFMLFAVSLIIVGLIVLAYVDFSDHTFWTMGKISVITVFSIYTLYNIIVIALWGDWSFASFLNLLLSVLVYGGLLALYFVFGAKFPLTSPDLPQAAGYYKPWNEGKVVTSFLALVSSGVLFYNYFSNFINYLPYKVNTDAVWLFVVGLILVGVNVAALIAFPEKFCRLTGKITVIAVLVVYVVAVAVDLIFSATKGYLEYYTAGTYFNMFLRVICYAVLPLIYFFVMNAKFPLNQVNAPAVGDNQINN